MSSPSRPARSLARQTLLIALSLLVALPAVAAHHEEEAPAPVATRWDADEVSRLAGALHEQVKEARRSFKREPIYRDPALMKQNAALQFEEVLKALERTARQLSSKAKGSAGPEATNDVVNKLVTLLRDAEEEGRKLRIGQWTNERLVPAMESLNALAPYYGSGPLYDMETFEATENL